MDWKLLLISLGLVLIIEGLPYFLFPARVTAILRQLESLEAGTLRWLGLLAMIAGVLLLTLGRWGYE